MRSLFVWLWLVVNDRKFLVRIIFFSHTNQSAVLLYKPVTIKTSQPNRLTMTAWKSPCTRLRRISFRRACVCVMNACAVDLHACDGDVVVALSLSHSHNTNTMLVCVYIYIYIERDR